MRIESQLHIASHPDRDPEKGYSFTNGEPHAMGLIKIPLDQIEQHERVKEIYDALPEEAKEFVKKEGNLAFSHDFSFVEDYKSGVGLIMTDLTLDISRLKSEEKTQIRDWLQDEYKLTVDSYEGANPDEKLQNAVNSVKHHIITDMTFAGMSRDYMMHAIEEHIAGIPEENRDCDLVPADQMTKYFDSLKERLELSDSQDLTSADRQKLDAYYDRVLKMEIIGLAQKARIVAAKRIWTRDGIYSSRASYVPAKKSSRRDPMRIVAVGLPMRNSMKTASPVMTMAMW